MDKFKIGDRIEMAKANYKVVKGLKGTVRAVSTIGCDPYPYGIEFDKDVHGHDLFPKENNCRPCKSGHGWWVRADEIQLIPKFEVGQVYKVTGKSAESGDIIKIADDEKQAWIFYETIRGSKLNTGFGNDSAFANSLILLQGKEIGEAIKKWDADHTPKSKSKYTEVKRPAKVGDTIRILRDEDGEVKPNSKWKVCGVRENGNIILAFGYEASFDNYVVVSSAKHSYTESEIAEAKKFVLDTIREQAENATSILFGARGYGGDNFTAYVAPKGCAIVHNEGNLTICDVKTGDSKCSSNDEPNEWIGRCVALCKALHRPIPRWIMAPSAGEKNE